MNRKRYITELSEREKAALKQVVKTGASHRERQRAQAILWSNEGKDMPTLLEWFQVDRDTLSSWFTRWQLAGVAGLKDKPKSGRPLKTSEEEQKKFSGKQVPA